MIFHGRRHEKTRATAWKMTGNEIYRNGQQKSERRATKFIATGNEILSIGQRDFFAQRTANFTPTLLFLANCEHIDFFLFCMRIIYIRMQKNKNPYLLAGRPP